MPYKAILEIYLKNSLFSMSCHSFLSHVELVSECFLHMKVVLRIVSLDNFDGCLLRLLKACLMPWMLSVSSESGY